MGATCLNESQCDEIAERSLNQQIDKYLQEEEELRYNCSTCGNVRFLENKKYCSSIELNGYKLFLLKKEYHDCEGWVER